MAGSHRLSKSRFTAGLQCHKQLWWRVHEPDAPELVPDAAQQAIFDQGTRVGEVARSYVPGGALVDLPHDIFAARIAKTRKLLSRRVPAIYEATFFGGDIYAAVDILERDGDRFHLIEVKSSVRVKEEHLPDLAVQLHVLRSNGLDVSRTELMHLNRECVYPHLEDLFVREDVTAEVEALQAGLPRLIAGQLRMLAAGLPDVPIGEHCRKPHACPFLGRCWRDVPEHHVSTLYRVAGSGADLVAQGFRTIADLLPDGLSAVQERQRRAVLTGRLVVEPGLGDALRVFHEPTAFLDFETVGPAIPAWDGCHPYEAVPVQFSCDRLAPDGAVAHHEWLADGPGDPRPELARALVAACRGARTVVAYNAGFERGRIEMLASSVPELAEDLLDIAARLADLLPVVREHVYHPDFHGSFSLKSVLPALVPPVSAVASVERALRACSPEDTRQPLQGTPGGRAPQQHCLSRAGARLAPALKRSPSPYDDLEVAEGATASLALERLMFRRDAMTADERQHLRDALLRYCALDTMSMIRMLDRLRELA
ncbi:MAG: DUF2779 domain-containing protein [Thermoanaerobaculaceae bacterium]|jgi:hypothetical protein